MSTPRPCFRLAIALALLLFGMPFSAMGVYCLPPSGGTPAAPGGQAGDAAVPLGFSSGPEAPAVPETGASSKAPEYSAVAAPGGVATVAETGSGHASTRECAVFGASTPLYLSHCAFLR